MKKVSILKAGAAAALVQDNATIVTGGFVGSCCPEALTKALENRFLLDKKPEGLTLVYSAAQGNRDGSGADHFAHKGLTKRVIAGHWNTAPRLGEMALANEIEAYNFPQGTLSQLFRDIAGHKAGTLTHVGLNTFVDPRNGGGKLNRCTTEDFVTLIEIEGQEQLLYKAFPIDICFLRGTFADTYGNITLEHEVASLDTTSIAQAVKNSGGLVIVQVENIVAGGTLDPRLVKIPGIYVDGIVLASPAEHEQSLGCSYDPSLSGERRSPVDQKNALPLSAKKIIARRAAMELIPNAVVNLGIGIPEYIAMVAEEEGIDKSMTLTVESGPIGGIPQGNVRFGASRNPMCILDQPYQFDFYDGGGIDLAFLGLAQADKEGNINVSKFGPRIAGCGGFINITQNAKKVVFCGTFTAGGLKTHISNGSLFISQEGKEQKFQNAVEQITFSGSYAKKTGQPVLYITERAVFELNSDGITLIELAPGIDLQKQVLGQMAFVPKISSQLKQMDSRLFKEEQMGLSNNEKCAIL